MTYPRAAHRRGLTLVEVLAALVLLTGIMLAAAAWVQASARATAATVPEARTRSAVEAVFRQLHDDLAIGDFDDDKNASPRVVNLHDRIEIRTRVPGHGAVTVTYRLEQREGTLVRVEHRRDGKRRRVLLDEVDEIVGGIREIGTEEDPREVLDVAITTRDVS